MDRHKFESGDADVRLGAVNLTFRLQVSFAQVSSAWTGISSGVGTGDVRVGPIILPNFFRPCSSKYLQHEQA